MADLSITMHGDASGASAAMKDVGGAAHEAHDQFHELKKKVEELSESFTVGAVAADAFEKALELMKDFVKESIEEYGKAEQAHLRLKAAAGALTAEFEEQAEAFEKTLHVRSQDIEQMQMLLLRYGAAPEVIGRAIEAVENYAAATGTDAHAAMMMLIRGVESGHGSLGRMGVQFDATGDKATDFGRAADALNAKLGGTAEAAAGGLVGRTEGVARAWEGLEKALGSVFNLVDSKLGILDGLTHSLEGLRAAFDHPGLFGVMIAQGLGIGDDEHSLKKAFGMGLDQGFAAGPGGGTEGGAKPTLTFGELDLKKTDKADLDRIAKKEEEKKRITLDIENQLTRALVQMNEQDEQDEEEHDAKILESKKRLSDMELKIQEDREKEQKEMDKEEDEKHWARAKDMQAADDFAREQISQKEQLWASTGMRLGQAFADAMTKAMEGGGQDAEDIAIDLTASILTIAGGVIGAIAGEGNPYAAQAGSMLGGLAGAGIKAAYHHSKHHHDGGWIERYHSGGWMGLGPDEVPFVGLRGERVLSQDQVSRMGGPSAVDRMANGRGGGGGGGLHIHVSAQDTRSAREFFENDGGRGFYNALRTGRGSLNQLFSGS